MNRNHFWKLVLIVLVLVWSYAEFTPMTNRDLVLKFRERAIKRDETFNKIFAQAQELQKKHPDRAYANLLEAIGTNDIVAYFPFFEGQNESRPTTFILNRLQREAAG